MFYHPSYQYQLITEQNFPAQILEIESELSHYANKGFLPSFDGLPLAYEYFLVESAKASVVIVHGFTEFYQKFYEMTWQLLNQGYHVFLFDLRGHGKSGREVSDQSITHVEHFNDYVRDLNEIIHQLVQKAAPAVPIYLYSHSMGGAIATEYLATEQCPIDRAILSSPMVCPSAHHIPSWIIRSYASCNAKKMGWKSCFPHSGKFNPNVTVEHSNDFSAARFTHFLKYRIHDPSYQNSSASNRWMYEAVSVKKQLLSTRLTKRIHAKVLILNAKKDTVVRYQPQRRLCKKIKGAKLIRFPNCKHSIYTSCEPILELFYQTVIDFFQ